MPSSRTGSLPTLSKQIRETRTFRVLSLRQRSGDVRFRRLPFRQPWPDDHRVYNQHDLVTVGVVRAELRSLVGLKAPLEERAENGRVNFRPIQTGRAQSQGNIVLVHWQGDV